MAKLPICQRTMRRRSSENTALNVVNTAFKKSDKTIPQRIIVLPESVLSIVEEKAATKKTVKSANTNPATGRVKLPKSGIEKPLTIIIPAPRDAPDDTPKI